jgi:hypothetical protein
VTIYAVNGKEPIAAWIPSLDTVGNGTTTLTDLVGSNNGTLTQMDPATDWVADTNAGGVRALDFDGSNDRVIMGPPAITQQMSQSYWFKRASTSVRSGLVGFGVISSSLDRFVIQPWSDGVVYVSLNGSNWGNFSSNDLNWHHLVAVFDGAATGNSNRLNVWFDGAAVSLSFTGTIPTTIGAPERTQIGRTLNPANDYGTGLVDDYRIWGQSLVLEDAQFLWAGGFGRGITAGGGIIPILRQHYAAQGAR